MVPVFVKVVLLLIVVKPLVPVDVIFVAVSDGVVMVPVFVKVVLLFMVDVDGVGYSAVSISETLYNDTTNSVLTNNIYCNNIYSNNNVYSNFLGSFKGVNIPRYDSGWFIITSNSNQTLIHNLNISFVNMPIHKLLACDTAPSSFSIGANITDITGQGITYNNVVGHILKYTNANTIQIYTGRDVMALVEVVGNPFNGATNLTTGYFRLLLY